MTRRCKKGDWVEVHQVILEAGQRSTDVPEDTSEVPLEAWIKGWALAGGAVGQKVEIQTPAGRTVNGVLTEISPGYTHAYGPSVPELTPIGRELRAMLKEGRSRG
jgi:hypothetical protein